jgi:hypothetical protein
MKALRLALKKLTALRNLPVGWNYGDGRPITAKAFRMSAVGLAYLDSVNAARIDVLPSDDGGATILAENNGSLAEIVVTASGLFDLFIENAEATVTECEGLDFGAMIGALEDAGWRSLKSYGSQTHVFTVESTGDSRAPLLETRGRGHLSFVQRASRPLVKRSAATLKNITKASEEYPQYSGGSLQEPLLVAYG